MLWVEADRALVIFGQSYPSGVGPYFTVAPKPGGFVNRATHFYLRDAAVVPLHTLELVGQGRLTSDDYRRVTQFMTEHQRELDLNQRPGTAAALLWRPPDGASQGPPG